MRAPSESAYVLRPPLTFIYGDMRYERILLALFALHCGSGAALQPTRRRDEEDRRTGGGGAAAAAKNSKVRRWMEKPASKGAALILAGGLSGAVAKTITAPLERAKIISQAGMTGSFLKIMREIVKAEGWQGLWRGNSANVIRVVPNKGILLMCSDMYKATVFAALPNAGVATISSIAGSLAGLTAVLLTYPLELVRTRMAFKICTDVACDVYASVWSTLREAMVSGGGVLGLYAGVGMTLVGSLPFEGIKFGVYDGKSRQQNSLHSS